MGGGKAYGALEESSRYLFRGICHTKRERRKKWKQSELLACRSSSFVINGSNVLTNHQRVSVYIRLCLECLALKIFLLSLLLFIFLYFPSFDSVSSSSSLHTFSAWIWWGLNPCGLLNCVNIDWLVLNLWLNLVNNSLPSSSSSSLEEGGGRLFF